MSMSTFRTGGTAVAVAPYFFCRAPRYPELNVSCFRADTFAVGRRSSEISFVVSCLSLAVATLLHLTLTLISESGP